MCLTNSLQSFISIQIINYPYTHSLLKSFKLQRFLSNVTLHLAPSKSPCTWPWDHSTHSEFQVRFLATQSLPPAPIPIPIREKNIYLYLSIYIYMACKKDHLSHRRLGKTSGVRLSDWCRSVISFTIFFIKFGSSPSIIWFNLCETKA